MKKARISRRRFIEKTSLVVSTASILPAAEKVLANKATGEQQKPAVTGKLPLRVLGRTGQKVPVIAFGCGSRFLMYREEEEALQTLSRVIDLGVTYLDTAIDYGDGLSETRVGKLMPKRRREVWLATKIPQRARTRETALREVEQSLKRLQTDHVDLLHIHSLGGEDDLQKIEAPDGVLKALYELRDQKVARFIGMTSHTDGAVMAKAIERHDLDCVQMAMNPARANKFEELALPAAHRKNLGVILMKVTAQEKLVGEGAGKSDIKSLISYALSLQGVTTAVIGMPRPEHIAENIRIASNFTRLSMKEMDELRQRVTPQQQASLEYYFSRHRDGSFV